MPVDNTARLDGAIRESLGLRDDMDISGIAYGEIEEWDSVAHMQMVAGIESAFDIMVDTDHVIAMSDYGVIRSILEEHYGVRFEP